MCVDHKVIASSTDGPSHLLTNSIKVDMKHAEQGNYVSGLESSLDSIQINGLAKIYECAFNKIVHSNATATIVNGEEYEMTRRHCNVFRGEGRGCDFLLMILDVN